MLNEVLTLINGYIKIFINKKITYNKILQILWQKEL